MQSDDTSADGCLYEVMIETTSNLKLTMANILQMQGYARQTTLYSTWFCESIISMTTAAVQ